MLFCLFGVVFRVDLGMIQGLYMSYMMRLRVYLPYEKQKKSRKKQRSR